MSISRIAATGQMSGLGAIQTALAAGQLVGMSKTGGTYLYPVPAMSNGIVPNEWTKYRATVSGGALRPATAFVRVGWQVNRSSQAGNRVAVSAVNFRETFL